MQEKVDSKNIVQELINYCHSFAENLLLEQKEFYPFGAYLDNEGELTPAGFYAGDEFPLSNTVIVGLKENFQKRLSNKEIRAYAITSDARIKNGRFTNAVDAISIQITQRDIDEVINYYFPYKLKQKQIEFLESWGEYA